MTLELPRRLMRAGAVSQGLLDACLLESLDRQMHWLALLGERVEDLERHLLAEFGRSGLRVQDRVYADVELARALPPGLCERLLVVPMRNAAGPILLVADPFDAHPAAEVAFQVRRPLPTRPARLSSILAALRSFAPSETPRLADEPRSERTPAFGTPTRRKSYPVPMLSRRPIFPTSPRPPSDAPIPLVRRTSLFPPEATRPGVGGMPPPPRFGRDEVGQPVLGLVRSKLAAPRPPNIPDALLPPQVRLAMRPSPLPPASLEPSPNEYVVLEAVRSARSAASVVQHLALGCLEVAGTVVVLSGGAGFFVGRGAAGIDEARIQGVRIPETHPVIVGVAEHGRFLGPLPAETSWGPLREAFEDGAEQVLILPVRVAMRVVLLLLMARMDGAMAAVRRGEQLTGAASEALARLLGRQGRF